MAETATIPFDSEIAISTNMYPLSSRSLPPMAFLLGHENRLSHPVLSSSPMPDRNHFITASTPSDCLRAFRSPDEFSAGGAQTPARMSCSTADVPRTANRREGSNSRNSHGFWSSSLSNALEFFPM